MPIPRDESTSTRHGHVPCLPESGPGRRPPGSRRTPARAALPFVLLVVLVLPVLLFVLMAWQVMADGPLVRLDERVSGALRHPDRFGEILSDLGNVEVAVPVLAAALLYAAWRARRDGTPRWWLAPGAAAVASALVPVLVIPLKILTDRPGTPAVPPATGYFPSGHTTTAALAYGCAALVLLPHWPRARRLLLGLAAALTLAVSYGLVRRGYHWALDVTAGWCLSAVLLGGCAVAVRVFSPSGRQP